MPVRQAHPFDGFDKLPFDKLRVCDTAGRLRMTLSRVEWVRAPSKVEGLALAATSKSRLPPVRTKTRFAVGGCMILVQESQICSNGGPRRRWLRPAVAVPCVSKSSRQDLDVIELN